VTVGGRNVRRQGARTQDKGRSVTTRLAVENPTGIKTKTSDLASKTRPPKHPRTQVAAPYRASPHAWGHGRPQEVPGRTPNLMGCLCHCVAVQQQGPAQSVRIASAPTLGAVPWKVPRGQATHGPEERMVGVLPRGGSARSRPQVAGADGMARRGCRQRVAAPHTSGGARTRATGRAARRQRGPLRPRNLSVPSSRPLPRRG
jgi:hypothetical protein